VLPTQAFLQITGLYDMRGGAALCFLLLVPALAIFVGSAGGSSARRLLRDVTGSFGAVTRIKSLSPVAIAGLGVFCGAVALLVLVCYSLIAGRLPREWPRRGQPSVFVHYAHVFSGGLKAVRDTLIIAVLCMPVGGLFAVVLASSSRAPSFPGAALWSCRHDELTRLPAPSSASPIWSPQRPAPVLTGTAFILVVCYVFPLQPGGDPRHTAVLAQSIPRSRSLREPGRTR